MSESQGLVRGTAITSALTLLSRVLGFLRDMILARLFGSGSVADAFFVAFRVPNMLRSFVAEGAFTAAFVPMFSSDLHKGKEHAQRTFSEVCGFLLALSTLLSILGIVFARPVAALFAPGFISQPEKFELCVYLMRITFPYIIFISLVALIGGALVTLKIFGFAAIGQVIMNLVLIFGAIGAEYAGDDAPELLAWFVLLGGIIQVAAQIPGLKRAGLSLRPIFSLFSKTIRQLLLLMVPAVIGAAVYQVVILFNTLLASLLSEGSVSWLFYADRLIQFPIGIFAIALASVLLPALSKAAAGKNEDLFYKNIDTSLRFTTFIMVPTAVGLGALAMPIVKVLFERGNFDPESTVMTALAIQGYAFGLWAISCHTMLVRAFLARKDTVTPTVVGVLSLAVNLVSSLILMGPIEIPDPGVIVASIVYLQNWLVTLTFMHQLFEMHLGHVGLALASSITSLFSALYLAMILKHRTPNLQTRQVGIAVIKSCLASLGMFVAINLSGVYAWDSYWQLIFGIPLGVVSYMVFSLILRSSELVEIKVIFDRYFARH